MTIEQTLEEKILRYHFVEKWPTGTIAKQLGIHHSVVDRILSHAGLPKIERTSRTSIIDPYLPFIIETLNEFPTLTAVRLYEMAKLRGFKGGPSQFRQRISELRPRKLPEAYLRLKTLPGEQCQVDWGHFGHLQIGKAKRPLMAFVMVLSWSRKIFLQFYLNQQMENFLRGHVAAFEAWQGLPRICLYDNLKSAVLERQGAIIRFNPTLLDLASHYHFEPKAAAPARGNEKGRVERAIRYIRDNFFAGRHVNSLEDLNSQTTLWCNGVSCDRKCPENDELTVKEAFILEQRSLLALPDNPFNTDERKVVKVHKTPYVRFDLNDYSVPHTQVQKQLTVHASLTQVRLIDGEQLIVEHPRSFDKGEQIEQEQHINALWLSKHKASAHRGQNRLTQASELSETFLQQCLARGHLLKRTTTRLNQFLDDYGRAELHASLEEALKQQTPSSEAVEQILEQRRECRHQPPPIAVSVPDKVKNITVKPAKLGDYDVLGGNDD